MCPEVDAYDVQATTGFGAEWRAPSPYYPNCRWRESPSLRTATVQDIWLEKSTSAVSALEASFPDGQASQRTS